MTTTTRSEKAPEGARPPRGIATTYAKTRFRSRLEARWAAFFDLVEWSWTYEPFDAEGWIPDFLIHGPFPFLVEVGPCVSIRDYIDKGKKARTAFPARLSWQGDLDAGIHTYLRDHWTLVAGVTPAYEEPEWVPGVVAAGVWAADALNVPADPSFAMWEICSDCGRWGTASPDFGGYKRPCGHATEGLDRYTRMGREVFDLWAQAGNRVQWRSR